MIEIFKEWEDVIYDNVESFEKEFCHHASFYNVFWNSETIKVLFEVDDNTLATDIFSIEKWFEWLKTKIS